MRREYRVDAPRPMIVIDRLERGLTVGDIGDVQPSVFSFVRFLFDQQAARRWRPFVVQNIAIQRLAQRKLADSAAGSGVDAKRLDGIFLPRIGPSHFGEERLVLTYVEIALAM